MIVLLRLIAWLLAAAVTFATLAPPSLRPHSSFGQNGEHALAFILVGFAFGVAYAQRRLAVSAVAVVMIGLLELLQFWAPGRHARLEDFLVDALAACVGIALSAAHAWAMTRYRENPDAITGEDPAE